jgi:hypothetical protein
VADAVLLRVGAPHGSAAARVQAFVQTALVLRVLQIDGALATVHTQVRA